MDQALEAQAVYVVLVPLRGMLPAGELLRTITGWHWSADPEDQAATVVDPNGCVIVPCMAGVSE